MLRDALHTTAAGAEVDESGPSGESMAPPGMTTTTWLYASDSPLGVVGTSKPQLVHSPVALDCAVPTVQALHLFASDSPLAPVPTPPKLQMCSVHSDREMAEEAAVIEQIQTSLGSSCSSLLRKERFSRRDKARRGFNEEM